jgi:hypothetical protein
MGVYIATKPNCETPRPTFSPLTNSPYIPPSPAIVDKECEANWYTQKDVGPYEIIGLESQDVVIENNKSSDGKPLPFDKTSGKFTFRFSGRYFFIMNIDLEFMDSNMGSFDFDIDIYKNDNKIDLIQDKTLKFSYKYNIRKYYRFFFSIYCKENDTLYFKTKNIGIRGGSSLNQNFGIQLIC